MKTLALLLLLAAPSFGRAEDPAAALTVAEAAVARHGRAEDYAARANAKLALGRPFNDVIADYAEAAKRDPGYDEKYQGLIEQRDSQTKRGNTKARDVQGETDANGLAKALGAVAVGILIFISGLVLIRGRASSAVRVLPLLLLLASPAFAAPQPAPADVAASTQAVASTTTVQPSSPPPGSLDSSKIRLDAQDSAGALRDAETALAHGGGADAYIARGNAKRALGRPLEEAIADYAEAAKLDPRYIEKYQGLIAQQESTKHPDSRSRQGGTGFNGLPIFGIGAGAAVGGLLIAVAVVMLRKRERHPISPDDEDVKPAGKADAAGEGHPKAADLEDPKKEPPKAS